MSTGNDGAGDKPAWVKVRPLILVFAGGDVQNLVVNSAQRVEPAFDQDVKKKSEAQKQIAAFGDSVDVVLAYRLSDNPAHDAVFAAENEAFGALTMAAGDWHWDTFPASHCPGRPIQFVENFSRGVFVFAHVDLPVMEVDAKATGDLRLWLTNLAKAVFRKHVDEAVRNLYRCPASKSIQQNLTRSPSPDEQKQRGKLASNLGCQEFGFDRDPRWQATLRLLGTALPLEDGLHIQKVLSGNSGAAAVLIGVPNKLPIIAKFGSPFAIGQELRGFLGVILPKLQNYVSRPLLLRPGMNGMLLTYVTKEGADGRDNKGELDPSNETLALTLLSAVGEPGQVANLRSLGDHFADAFANPEGLAEKVLKRLDTTLQGMVGKLHLGAKARGRTIWQSYGGNLPAWLELSTNAPPGTPDACPVGSLAYSPGGDERGMLAHDALQLAALHQSTGGKAGRLVAMQRMALFEVKSEGAKGKVELRHPRLGVRISISSRTSQSDRSDLTNIAAPLAKQAAVRRGHYADAQAWLTDRKDMRPFANAAEEYQQAHGKLIGQWCPLEVFGGIKSPANAADAATRSPTPPLPGDLARALLDVSFPTAMGATHGDLNLDNIQFSGESELGWLIDFERSVADGPIAFDYAKLQVELLMHHGLQVAIAVATAHQPNKSEPSKWGKAVLNQVEGFFDQIFQFLHTTPSGDPAEYLRAQYPKGVKREQELFMVDALHEVDSTRGNVGKLAFLLRSLACIQRHAMVALQVAHSGERKVAQVVLELAAVDLALARAAYAFVAIKHASRNDKLDPEIAACLFAVSVSSLNLALGSDPRSKPEQSEKALEVKTWQREKRFAYLWLMTQKLPSEPPAAVMLSAMTSIAGVSPEAKPMFDPNDGNEYWDVASTGGIGNLSPILGYLLLMARRETAGEIGENKRIHVPKICSPGSGGGTQDTLEAGGYAILTEPADIVAAVKEKGGCIVGQDKSLVPADKALMDKRKDLGLMKCAELAFASILGKKLPLGSRHIVIDVKLGADSKMLPRLPSVMSDVDATERLRIAREALLLDGMGDGEQGLHVLASQVPHLDAYLRALLVGGSDPVAETRHSVAVTHRAKGPGDQPQEQAVRLVYSNGDMPQCRAVGRLPLLYQLDRIFADNDLAELPKYEQFYFQHLAIACGWNMNGDTKRTRDVAKTQWDELKKSSLQKFDIENNEDLSCIAKAVNRSDPSIERSSEHGQGNGRLNALTLCFRDVPPWAGFGVNKSLTLAAVDVNPLDSLFEDLTPELAAYKSDPGIGFWFHTLPGERALTEGDRNPPLLSTFFRQGVDESVLKSRLVDYMIRNWRWLELTPENTCGALAERV